MMFRIRFKSQKGFNLVELAIVLVILGVLLGGLITPLGTQQEVRKRKATDVKLLEIHNATLGFVANTGRLPCPATTTSNGLSAPNIATTACTSAHGFVPARTLGLVGEVDGNGLLIDEWLNPLRYSLTSAESGAYSNNIVLGLTPDFQACSQSACSSILADNIVAVIFSLGEDGTITTSADQLENTDGDTVFVTRTISESAGTEFDDHLQWISPNTLAFHLVQSGQIN